MKRSRIIWPMLFQLQAHPPRQVAPTSQFLSLFILCALSHPPPQSHAQIQTSVESEYANNVPLSEMQYNLSLSFAQHVYHLTTGCFRAPEHPQIASSLLQPPRQRRLWQPSNVFLLLSLSTHTMLLPTNSQLYPEMKSHHFCQESHAETWLCFVSGHTVFDKIRRSHHINIFTQEEREIKRRVKLTSYEIQYREERGKNVSSRFQISRQKIPFPILLCYHLWHPASH